jgi:hypothetical protein
MRPLRPLFSRSAAADELNRNAERLRNRDWVEILRVVHPSQAVVAEREYILARLREDWGRITSQLLATHSRPTALDGRNLLVLCDHNTFANELSLLARTAEKRIATLYNYELKIHARASKRMNWAGEERKAPETKSTDSIESEERTTEKHRLQSLIDALEKL